MIEKRCKTCKHIRNLTGPEKRALGDTADRYGFCGFPLPFWLKQSGAGQVELLYYNCPVWKEKGQD